MSDSDEEFKIMSDYDDPLEDPFVEAGEKLRDQLPSSVPELLQLLDRIYSFLSTAESLEFAETFKSTADSLRTVTIALVAPRLLQHSDVNVKVAVAACVIHIMRLYGSKTMYNDVKLKEVFQLFVSSFEHLADISSYSYTKRISILETMAKSKHLDVMLDLGCESCDELVVEMFQHFLKGISDQHSKNVFSYMENIMALVLEKSKYITSEMLSPILQYVTKDDKNPKVSRRLAEQVLVKCASKLKNCLAEAVEFSGLSLDEYSNIVASICEGNELEDTQKAAEVSNTEQTCVPKRSPEAGVKTQEKRTHEMVEEEDETRTQKRARLHKAHDEMQKSADKSSPETGDLH